MLDKQKQNQYYKFKNSIFGNNNSSNTSQSSVSDTLDHQQILQRARIFIHRIKDHGHNKIKAKQIDKFERLYFKIRGCHHNLSRHNNYLDNTDRGNRSLSGQPNVPSSIPTSSSNNSNTSNTPATPTPPILPTTTMANCPTQGNSTSGNPPTAHTCSTPMDKWVINLSSTPLSKDQLTLLQKGPNYAIIPKHPPGSLHHSN